MYLSVVICTHNPRIEYLLETLDSLKVQTLPRDQWELLIIDNASDEPLQNRCDLSWHPHGRCVQELELGLTPARMRGILEAKGELLIFVDDDNLLDAKYLETARNLARNNPWLGAFGAANITPRFEQEPAQELRWWCGALALREDNRDLFSNFPELTIAKPFGAGLCVRRSVADAFLAKEKRSQWPVFDRKGKSLMSSGDLQFSIAAADCGMGYGIFASLSLTHLISARRVQLDYLLNINEAIAHSNSLLDRLRQHELGAANRTNAREFAMFFGYALKIIKANAVNRKFWWRSALGQWKALRDYRQIAQVLPGRN